MAAQAAPRPPSPGSATPERSHRLATLPRCTEGVASYAPGPIAGRVESARESRSPLFAGLLLLAPAAAAAPAPPTIDNEAAFAVTSGDACLDDEEIRFLSLINSYRAASGLKPLSVSTSLSSAAAFHSIDMAENGYLDHTMPDGTSVEQNLANFGYSAGTYGENIAAGTDTADAAMQTWQNSAEHNANMLNSAFGAIGIGRAYDPDSGYGWYWTTDFGDVSDGPGWLCGQAAPASKSVSLFQNAQGATASSDVNVRTGPGSDYAAVSTLAPGTEMHVTGRDIDGYLPVSVDGTYGWVSSDWVEKGVVSLEQTAAPSQSGTATAVDTTELRAAPSSDGNVVGAIPAVSVVSLTGQAQDGYLQVEFNGQEGWADAAYMQVADIASGAVKLQPAVTPADDQASAAAPAAPTLATAPGSQAVATTDVNLRCAAQCQCDGPQHRADRLARYHDRVPGKWLRQCPFQRAGRLDRLAVPSVAAPPDSTDRDKAAACRGGLVSFLGPFLILRFALDAKRATRHDSRRSVLIVKWDGR